MTERRDLKRRVRERMTETGESYTAALRHVLAARPDDEPTIAVVEMLDVTQAAARLGMRCRVMLHPELASAAGAALDHLTRVLRGTADDHQLANLRAVVLRGEPVTARPGYVDPFMRRIRAGLGGISEGGTMLAAHVDDRMTLFMLWLLPPGYVERPPTLLVTTPETMEWRVR